MEVLSSDRARSRTMRRYGNSSRDQLYARSIRSNPVVRLKAFAYVNAEKAPVYRAIMRAFMQAKERFKFHLRPQEIADISYGGALPDWRFAVAPDDIDSALAKLCEW